MKLTHVLAMSLLLMGCRSTPKERRVSPEVMNVRNGILILGQHREWFLQEWGAPSKTYAENTQGNSFESIRTKSSAESAEQKGAGDSSQAGKTQADEHFVIKGRGRNCDVWVYDAKGVTLFFDRRDLVGWQYKEGPRVR